MSTEQAEVGQENTAATSFSGVLSEALNQGAEVEAASPQQTSESSQNNQAESVQSQTEQLWAELSVDDKNKIGFKSEKEFQDFIDRNKLLKESTMRQQDYTRKTQEVSKSKKEFESRLQQFESLWGDVKPNEASLKGIQAIWNAYQRGTPEYQQELNAIVGKAIKILEGENPSIQQAPAPYHPKIDELEQKVSQFENMFDRLAYEKADNEWKGWKSQKESSGMKITEDVEGMMAHFLAYTDPKTGKPFSLDKAYDYAVRELGLENVDATKKVFQNANALKKKTGSAPNSTVSANSKPEPKSFGEIFRQAAEQL